MTQYATGQLQTVQKSIYLSKSNNAYSRDIVETTPGNFVLIGHSNDSTGNQVEYRLTLVGTDKNGNVNWRKSYGGNKFTYIPMATSAHYLIKHDGFLYMASPVTDSTGRSPGVLVKFDYNGDTIWQRKFYQGNSSAINFFASICPSIDNGFLITGAVQTNSPGFNNHPTVGTYILKTDINGNKLWEKYFYKANLDLTEEGADVVQDRISKRIYIVGVQDNVTGGSAMILILDSLGNLIGQKGGKAFGDGLMSVIQLKDGNLLACGAVSYPPLTIDPVSKSFLAKFDLDGNLVYTEEYDTLSFDNSMSRIAEFYDGSIITLGTLDVTHEYTNEIRDLTRIMKVDKNGKLVWKKYFRNYSDGFSQDIAFGMTITVDKQIAFTSLCPGHNPPPVKFMFYRTDTTSCDLNAFGCYDFVGLSKIKSNQFSVAISPNPASDFLDIRCEYLSGQIPLKYEIRNSLGELVLDSKYETFLIKRLSVEDLKSGLYFLILRSESQLVKTEKLIIVK